MEWLRRYYSKDNHVFQALIDWGDGSDPDIGYISFNTDNNQFEVYGDHTFTAAGDYTITISMNEDGDALDQVTDSATVNNQSVSGVNNLDAVIENQDFNQTVASLGDGSGLDNPSDYSATISWGDGTTSDGSINEDGTVTGAYNYGHVGYFNVTVTVFHNDQQIATVNENIWVTGGGPIENMDSYDGFYSGFDFNQYAADHGYSLSDLHVLDQPIHGSLSLSSGIGNYLQDSDFEGYDAFTFCFGDGENATSPVTVQAIDHKDSPNVGDQIWRHGDSGVWPIAV